MLERSRLQNFGGNKTRQTDRQLIRKSRNMQNFAKDDFSIKRERGRRECRHLHIPTAAALECRIACLRGSKLPPNELCPALLVSGLTVQPCGELRCFATVLPQLVVTPCRFALFEFVSAIRQNKNYGNTQIFHHAKI